MIRSKHIIAVSGCSAADKRTASMAYKMASVTAASLLNVRVLLPLRSMQRTSDLHNELITNKQVEKVRKLAETEGFEVCNNFSQIHRVDLSGLLAVLQAALLECLLFDSYDALTPAQLGDRIFTAQAFENNADLFFRAILFAVARRISRTCAAAEDCGPEFDLIFAP